MSLFVNEPKATPWTDDVGITKLRGLLDFVGTINATYGLQRWLCKVPKRRGIFRA